MNSRSTARLFKTLVPLLILSVRHLSGAAHAERAAGIVLDGLGSIAATPRSMSRLVEAGSLMFGGELLRSQSPMTVAVCWAGKHEGLVMQLPLGQGLTIADSPTSVADLATSVEVSASSTTLPVCELPSVDRSKQAENAAGPQDVSFLPEDIRRRLASTDPKQAELFSRCESLAQEPEFRLVGLVSEAEILKEARFLKEALKLYRQIRHDYQGAWWTRSVISAIDEELLFFPGGSAPDLIARVRPMGATGTVDSAPDFSKGETFALLVGLSKYPDGKGPDLKYADADAMTVAAFLQSEQGGKVPPENIELLTNADATRDAFEARLMKVLTAGIGPRNTLLIFVAGHGTYSCTEAEQDIRSGMAQSATPDKTCPEGMIPFIVMRDGDREAPNITGYPMQRLRELITSHASSFGRVLIFIDVCHGGNTTWNVDVRPPLRNIELISNLKAKGGLLGILTGSDVASRGNEAKEYAYESAKLKHGVFTFFLLKGLTGAAPVIAGTVPILQLSSYIRSSVQQFTNLKTSPGEFWTDGTMPVVGNPNAVGKAELNLVDAPEMASLISRGSAIDDLGLSKALRLENLLQTNPEIRNALEALRAHYGASSPEYALAMDRYRVALENKGQEIIGRYLLGDQDPVPAEDFERCGQFFDAAYVIAPDAAFDESRALFCRGRRMMFSKTPQDFDAARNLLQSSIAIDSSRSYAYNALGISYLERANQDSALLPLAMDAFAKAIEFEPKWAYPRHNLALALSEAGRYTEAVKVYGDAMRIGPQYSYLPFNLGLLYQTIRNGEEAKSAYALAIRIADKRCSLRSIPAIDACPERALPRAGLASLSAQESKHKQSEDLYHRALQDSPADLIIKHDLASLYAGWKGHEALAERIWTENLRVNPFDIPSLVGFTTLLKRECRFNDALPWLRNLTMQAPQYEPARLDLALAEVHSGTPKQAQATLKLARSRSAEYWAITAETSRALGDSAAAEMHWQTALEKAGDARARADIRRRRSNSVSCPL